MASASIITELPEHAELLSAITSNNIDSPSIITITSSELAQLLLSSSTVITNVVVSIRFIVNGFTIALSINLSEGCQSITKLPEPPDAEPLSCVIVP